MKKILAALALSCALIGPSAAEAGVYTDDLSKCLVSSTSEGDRTVLVRWIFLAVSVNPALKDIMSVNEAERTSTSKQAMGLMERLMLDSCRKQTIEAVKYEGRSAIESSFSVLGAVATRGLMSDPVVTAELAKVDSFMDKARWEKMASEAGITPVGDKPAK